jgi:hypothetical protein
MDELEEALSRQAMMPHQEILKRFKKIFGRNMSSRERKEFFLPHEPSLPEEENSAFDGLRSEPW